MSEATIERDDFVRFLKWSLPRLGLRWAGFRKVRGTVRKRLARRMRELGDADLSAYRERLERDPSEWIVLDGFCRIPISRFYRDKAVCEALERTVLPDCAQAARGRGEEVVRVLSAGCASGEEPYTVGLIWQVRLAQRLAGASLRILAVDSDETMLRRAEQACYAPGSFRDMPDDLLEAGFARVDGRYCLREAFRRCVRLERADLRRGVPAGPFDAVLCRNCAFTYFDAAGQAAAFAGFDAALRPGGYLVVGAHETLPGEASGYRRLGPGLAVYRKDPARGDAASDPTASRAGPRPRG